MATPLVLRRRIKTAQNVSKTTRAFQMISASKLKRAQHATFATRPYVEKLIELTKNIAPKPGETTDTLHPYMTSHIQSKKTLYIIIAPDKGLCGGLITNILREYLKYRNDNAYFVAIGKKIEAPVAASNKQLIASFPFGINLPPFDMVLPVIDIVDDYFLNKKVDAVKIITTHFMTVFSQTAAVVDLLPIAFEEKTEEKKQVNDVRLFEPNPRHLLPPLLRRYIEMVLYQQLLESYVSEQAARMLSMQNATNNAKDLVNDLRLIYNKVRQERITNEILDISSASVSQEEK